MATAKKRRTNKRPVWERGYLSHGLWLGTAKVWAVKIDRESPAGGKYRWEAGNQAGERLGGLNGLPLLRHGRRWGRRGVRPGGGHVRWGGRRRRRRFGGSRRA